MAREETMECVGSLLVSAHDVQELSKVPSAFSPQAARSTLKERGTAVGTLVGTLMVTSDAFSPTTPTADGGHGQDSVSKGCISSLQRRITQKLMGPPPHDAEADTWAD